MTFIIRIEYIYFNYNNLFYYLFIIINYFNLYFFEINFYLKSFKFILVIVEFQLLTNLLLVRFNLYIICCVEKFMFKNFSMQMNNKKHRKIVKYKTKPEWILVFYHL